MITRNAEWIQVAEKYKDLSDKIAYLTLEKSKLYEELKILSNYEDSCGGGYEFKSIDRIGTINYKDIPELKNVDLGKYRGDNINYFKLSFNKQFKEIL